MRICPACGINEAASGDRYCSDCGSAVDRSAWVNGPENRARVPNSRARTRGSWAPQPRVCWMCGAAEGSKHAETCVFEGAFE